MTCEKVGFKNKNKKKPTLFLDISAIKFKTLFLWLIISSFPGS